MRLPRKCLLEDVAEAGVEELPFEDLEVPIVVGDTFRMEDSDGGGEGGCLLPPPSLCSSSRNGSEKWTPRPEAPSVELMVSQGDDVKGV